MADQSIRALLDAAEQFLELCARVDAMVILSPEAKVGAHVVSRCVTSVIKNRRSLQKRIVPFVFDFYIPSELETFGADLLKEDVLPLPYKDVAFIFPERTLNRDGSLDDGGMRSAVVLVDVSDVVNQIRALAPSSAAAMQLDGYTTLMMGYTILADTVMIDAMGLVAWDRAVSIDRGYLFNSMPFPVVDYLCAFARATGAKYDEKDVQGMVTSQGVNGHRALGCVALLNSKYVSKKEPTEKEKRKSLRHPLEKRQQRAEVRVSLVKNERSGPGDGTRASPIPHWRRGHIRKLPDKTVKVQPTLVNMEMGNADVKPYRVSGGVHS